MANTKISSDNLVAKGAGWMIALRWLGRSLGFIRIMILARLLSPVDFGIFALAMMVLGLLEAVTSVRPDFILIQDKNAEKVDYDTVWTFMIIRGLIVAAILITSANYISYLLDEPEVELILYVLAFSILLEGFQNVGIVNFYKNLTFDRVFLLDIVGRIFGLLSSIIIAFWFRNYWALVAGFAASRIALLGTSYLIDGYRPRLCLESWKKVFHFSKWLALNGLSATIRFRSASLVIGKWLGTEALGFYSVGKKFAELAGADLVVSLRNVIFPAQTKNMTDIKMVRRLYVNSFCIIFLTGAPISIIVGISAEPLVLVFLGAQWIGTIPIVKILVFYALLHLCTAASSGTLLAIGRTREMAFGQTLSTIITIPLVFVGMKTGGVYGVSLAIVMSAGLTAFIFSYTVVKIVGGFDLNSIKSLIRSCFALVLMAYIVSLINYDITLGSKLAENIFDLIFKAFIGGSLYIFILYLLWQLLGEKGDPEELILDYLWKKIGSSIYGAKVIN